MECYRFERGRPRMDNIGHYLSPAWYPVGDYYRAGHLARRKRYSTLLLGQELHVPNVGRSEPVFQVPF